MKKSVQYHFQVRWGETDAAGIVFYPNFYGWMDEATHHFFAKIGYPTTKLFEDEMIGIPIVEAKCQFKSPLVFGDNVNITSTVSEYRNKAFTIQHTFKKGEQTIAEGYEIRVWTNFKNSKPKAVAIPNEIRAAIDEAKIFV